VPLLDCFIPASVYVVNASKQMIDESDSSHLSDVACCRSLRFLRFRLDRVLIPRGIVSLGVITNLMRSFGYESLGAEPNKFGQLSVRVGKSK
jgi:hypothetical protein